MLFFQVKNKPHADCKSCEFIFKLGMDVNSKNFGVCCEVIQYVQNPRRVCSSQNNQLIEQAQLFALKNYSILQIAGRATKIFHGILLN